MTLGDWIVIIIITPFWFLALFTILGWKAIKNYLNKLKCGIAALHGGRKGKTMSNFRAMTRATDTALAKGVDDSFREWQPANWLDNHFGGRRYGIKFDDDPIIRADNGDFVYDPDMEVLQQGPTNAK